MGPQIKNNARNDVNIYTFGNTNEMQSEMSMHIF